MNRPFADWAGHQIEKVCARNDVPRPGKKVKPPWETHPSGKTFWKVDEEMQEVIEAYFNWKLSPTEEARAHLQWELSDLAATAMMLSARVDPIMQGLRRGKVCERDFPEEDVK